MDGDQVMYKLAACIAENNRREAEAVQGYTEQLALVHAAQELFGSNAEWEAYLAKLESATQEKIADELSHSNSLNAEYSEMTGIAPKED